MDNSSWDQLLELLSVHGKIRPNREEELKAYEAEHGILLPASYRSFCLVFGPGVLADWYTLAVPGYDGRYKAQFDLAAKTDCYRKARDWAAYSSNPNKFARTVIFGDDTAAAVYFLNVAEPTEPSHHEYAVYALFSDSTVERLSDTFSGFIDICLHRGARTIYDDPPKMEFRPATGWKRQSKKQ